MTVKYSFSAYARAHRRLIGVVTLGFIRNSRAVLLLAACRIPKSDRLLARLIAQRTKAVLRPDERLAECRVKIAGVRSLKTPA